MPGESRIGIIIGAALALAPAWAQPMRRDRRDGPLATSGVVQRAETLSQQGRAPEAASLLEEEAQRDPDNAEVILSLARTWRAQREWEKAAEWYERATGFRGLRADALYELAGVRALSGDKAGALETLSRASLAGFRRHVEASRDPSLAYLFGDPRFEAWVDAGSKPDAREGPTAGPGDPGALLDADVGESLDRSVVGVGVQAAFSGSVGAVRRSRVLIRKGYGLADRAAGVAMTSETLFPIGSITRSFVAATMLRLDQDGLLRVDDPIARLIPEAPQDKSSITILQVLTHSSGLDLGLARAEEAPIGTDEASRDLVLRKILSNPLAFDPGSSARWSRANDALACVLIERATGQSFEDAVRARVLAPAGLRSTRFAGEAIGREMAIAIGYGAPDLPEDPRAWRSTPWSRKGSEGILASVGDLLAWVKALGGDAVLDAAHRDLMFTGHAPSGRLLGRAQGVEGLGWFMGQSMRGSSVRAAWSEDDRGFACIVAWYPEEEACVVVASNGPRADEARDVVRRSMIETVLPPRAGQGRSPAPIR